MAEQGVGIALVDVEATGRGMRAGAFHIHQLCQSIVEQISRDQCRRNSVDGKRFRQKSSIAMSQKNGDGLVRVRYRQRLLAGESECAGNNLYRADSGGRAAARREQASASAKQNVYLV